MSHDGTGMATVCLTFDFDAISLWIGPMGATSPSMISRGEFGVVGVERILRLLARDGIPAIPATFFVTGHTAETYPGAVQAIVDAGHEIGHHGYLHENPVGLASKEDERRVLERGLEALDRTVGVRPAGYRSPAWDNSPHTIELLLEYGFRYESSLMGHDFVPYWCRVGDRIQDDGPYLFGREVDLVEMPVSWILDDFPHFEYVRLGNRLSPGLSAASKVEEIWRGEFDFMVRDVPGGVFTLTMHPQVIGRGHRMLMLERLIAHMQAQPTVRFTTLGEAAESFRGVPRLSRTGLPSVVDAAGASRRHLGSVAIVTGVARGLGLGIARRLSEEGAQVVLADVDPLVVDAAAELGQRASGEICDVSDSAAVDRLVAATVEQLGRLDLMVANAGIGGGAPVADTSDDLWRRILAVNLDGSFHCCRAAARAMIPHGSGVILTVGSIFGRDTPAGSAAYGAAKAGVVALTHALARELGPHGIRVNCVSPGNMATEMHWAALRRRATNEGTAFDISVAQVRAAIPLGRHGEPEDIAALVSFLASADAAYITGQTINVDGGYQPR